MGEEDTIVPPARTKRLAECFTATTVDVITVPRGHNDIFEEDEVREELEDILRP